MKRIESKMYMPQMKAGRFHLRAAIDDIETNTTVDRVDNGVSMTIINVDTIRRDLAEHPVAGSVVSRGTFSWSNDPLAVGLLDISAARSTVQVVLGESTPLVAITIEGPGQHTSVHAPDSGDIKPEDVVVVGIIAQLHPGSQKMGLPVLVILIGTTHHAALELLWEADEHLGLLVDPYILVWHSITAVGVEEESAPAIGTVLDGHTTSTVVLISKSEDRVGWAIARAVEPGVGVTVTAVSLTAVSRALGNSTARKRSSCVDATQNCTTWDTSCRRDRHDAGRVI
jgi:hypothetical protein